MIGRGSGPSLFTIRCKARLGLYLKFNSSALIRSIPMKAVAYRSNFKDTPYYNYLPDIFLEQSGYAFL